MFEHLKNIFSTILICLLSATVILNILKYIWVSPKLFLLSQIYRQPFNQSNLIYIVSLLHKIGFKDLDFFISSENAVHKILKTMIFVDKIDNVIQIIKHLHLRLLEYI